MEFTSGDYSRDMFAPELWEQLHQQDPEKYPLPTEEEMKPIRERKIRGKYAKAIEGIIGKYSLVERETWVTQYLEAVAWTADNTIETPMLSGIADALNVEVADVVAKIMERESKIRGKIGKLIGKQMKELRGIGVTDDGVPDITPGEA